MNQPAPIRVLVVDDSALMRQMLGRFLREEGLDVVGLARNGEEALALVADLRPDVVTLDVEMPGMDGLETLSRLLAAQPLPVVMCSGLTGHGAEASVRALEIGAVDVVAKPRAGLDIGQVGAELARKVRAAAGAHVRRPASIGAARRVVEPIPVPRRARTGGTRVIVIASSTGGPSALAQIFASLPGDLPAALIVVQHMPAGFTASLARRLDDGSPLKVREAAQGDVPEPGLALLAPGSLHLEIDERGVVCLSDAPPVHGVRPAADVTLRSLLTWRPGQIDLVVLTGMGSDGLNGARGVKAGGGKVIAEAESTAVVWGMPGVVVEAGLADQVLPLPEIGAALVALASRA